MSYYAYTRQYDYRLISPSAAYMHQWTGSALVQVMAWRLFGAKPLPVPMQPYCQLDSWEQISVKLELEFYHFHAKKCIWKCRLPHWWPFCPGNDDELRHIWLKCHMASSIRSGSKLILVMVYCTTQSNSFSVDMSYYNNHDISIWKFKFWNKMTIIFP